MFIGKKPIGYKWVYKMKLNPDNAIERYKVLHIKCVEMIFDEKLLSWQSTYC
ncbi:unnamed protein product [Spirodela intermedia]|uniref:Uncharacterized protein n=1 Tax=Spirodela intermedia TaxID=51605 RepID=A0A7I8JFL3_SPIIN|nr:unnamed protein product [Spirodela intermedia]CAA6668929.1 unnamed protein product [Spirodela intermedia]